MKYLSRVDSGRTHCWWVRIGTPGKKTYVQQSFTDAKYGNAKTSFDAAIIFLKAQCIEKKISIDEISYVYKEKLV